MTATLYSEVADALHRNGYRPVPIVPRQKYPSMEEWQNYAYVAGEQFPDHGCGLILGDAVAVDIDVRDPAHVEALTRILGEVVPEFAETGAPRRVGAAPKALFLFRAVVPFSKITGATFKLPADAPGDKTHKVEVLADGQQAVAYGVHPDTGAPYVWNGVGDPTTVPIGLLPSISEAQAREFVGRAVDYLASVGERVGSGRVAGPHGEPNPEQRAADPAEAFAALSAIPADDRDVWIRAGLAFKGAVGDQGLENFLRWSATSDKYNEADARARWEGFNPDRIGMAALIGMARDHGWQREYTAEFIDTTFDLPAEVQQEVVRSDDGNSVFTQRTALAYLVARFGYVTVIGGFWDRWTRWPINKQTIIDMMNRRMPWVPKGRGENQTNVKLNPTYLLLAEPAAMFERIEYHPGERSRYADDEGLSVLNTYVPPSIAPVVGVNVLPLTAHVAYLYDSDQAAAGTFLDWLAYLVQHPGEKINWAPLHINKNEGTGRGWLAHLMGKVLGDHNVFVADSHRLTGRFNEYLLSTQLLVVPELYIGGQRTQKQDVWEIAKTLITDPQISVEGKGLRAVNVRNRVNAMFMSQHLDAVALNDADRRLWVWVSEAASKSRAYYKSLYDWADNPTNAGGVLAYLRGRDLSGFDAKGRAPRTAGRELVVAEGRDPVEQYLRLAQEQSSEPFARDLVAVSEVVDWLTSNHIGRATPNSVATALEAIGAVKLNRGQSVPMVAAIGGHRKLWAVRSNGLLSALDYPAMTPAQLAAAYQRPSWDGGVEPDDDDASPLSRRRRR